MSGAALIPATAVVVVGLSEADRVISKGTPTMKPVIGGFVLGLFLYGIDAVNDDLARLFCILIIVAAILEHGVTVFGRVVKFFQ